MVYLSFDPATTRDCIRLGIYGMQPVGRRFKHQLQVRLEDKLVELTAKTVSSSLSRNSQLHTSYINFFKHSGSSRQLTLKFVLPAYVQDVFFYCTIARQIMLNTQVFSRIVLEKKMATVKSASELMHPSGFGYNLLPELKIATTEITPTVAPEADSNLDSISTHTNELKTPMLFPRYNSQTAGYQRPFLAAQKFMSTTSNEGNDIDSSSLSAESESPVTQQRRMSYASVLNRPILVDSKPPQPFRLNAERPRLLVRNQHVEAEVADATKISPVFFGKKKNLQKPRHEFRFDESLVVWQKSEFTFLYNFLPSPGPALSNNSAQYRNLVKSVGLGLVGQGLALIEVSPQHIKYPAAAFPSLGSSIGVGDSASDGKGKPVGVAPPTSSPQRESPPILLSGSVHALEQDVKALQSHLSRGEPLALSLVSDSVGPVISTVVPTLQVMCMLCVDESNSIDLTFSFYD